MADQRVRIDFHRFCNWNPFIETVVREGQAKPEDAPDRSDDGSVNDRLL